MLRFHERGLNFYPNGDDKPVLIRPNRATPNHSLYLSNLDDQKFLRFSIKYLYVFKKSVSVESLKQSLSRVLVDYYPLAGRLRVAEIHDDGDQMKLEVDCNGEGAVFAEAFADFTFEEFLESSSSSSSGVKPNGSWRKLLHRVEAPRGFLDIPPLVVQVGDNIPNLQNLFQKTLYIFFLGPSVQKHFFKKKIIFLKTIIHFLNDCFP